MHNYINCLNTLYVIKIQVIFFFCKIHLPYTAFSIDNESFSECIIWIFPEIGGTEKNA